MDVIYQNEGRVQWRMNDDPVSEAVPTICHAKMKTVTYYLMPMHSLHSTDLYNVCIVYYTKTYINTENTLNFIHR